MNTRTVTLALADLLGSPGPFHAAMAALVVAVGCGEASPKTVRRPSSEPVTVAQASPLAAVEELPPDEPKVATKLDAWVARALQPEHYMVATLKAAEVRRRLVEAGVWGRFAGAAPAANVATVGSDPVNLLRDESIEAHAAYWAPESLLLLTRYAGEVSVADARRAYAKTLKPHQQLDETEFHGRKIWRPKTDGPTNPDDCRCLLDERTLAVGDEFTLRKTIAWWSNSGGARLPLAVAAASLSGDELLSVAAARRPAEEVVKVYSKQTGAIADRLRPLFAASDAIETLTLGVRDLPLSAELTVRATSAANARRVEPLLQTLAADAHAAAGEWVAGRRASADATIDPEPHALTTLTSRLKVETSGATLVVRTKLDGSLVEAATSVFATTPGGAVDATASGSTGPEARAVERTAAEKGDARRE